jgi:hypothetical protein
LQGLECKIKDKTHNGFTLIGSSLACQGQTSVDDKDIKKHSGLLQYGNNYGRKKFNSSGANVIKLFVAVSYEFT